MPELYAKLLECEHALTRCEGIADGALKLFEDEIDRFGNEPRYFAFEAMFKQMQAEVLRASEELSGIWHTLDEHEETHSW